MTGAPTDRLGPTRCRRLPVVVAACAIAAAVASCGDDDDDPGVSQAELVEFCAEMERLGGERPEAYVGSAEHLEDMNALVEVAPDEIRASAEAYRDYVGSGVLEASGDPDANLTENFPPDVQQAIAEIRTYESTNC